MASSQKTGAHVYSLDLVNVVDDRVRVTVDAMKMNFGDDVARRPSSISQIWISLVGSKTLMKTSPRWLGNGFAWCASESGSNESIREDAYFNYAKLAYVHLHTCR